MRKPKRWNGTKPVNCDVCKAKLQGYFVDGKLGSGPWAILCLTCWNRQGMGQGQGFGQVYDLTTLELIPG